MAVFPPAHLISRQACFHPISDSPHREKRLLTSMYGFEDLAPAIKFCGSKSVRSSTSKRTSCLVTGVSGAIFMPVGHLPKVTLHQGPLNTEQLLTATLAPLRAETHLRASRSVLFPPHFFSFMWIYPYCTYKGGNNLAHLLSRLFLFLCHSSEIHSSSLPCLNWLE